MDSYQHLTPVMFVDPFGLKAYIFYGKDQEVVAKQDAKALEEKYGKENIELIFVDNPEDFIEGWNAMGIGEDGEEVPIEYVEINMHGDCMAIGVQENQRIDLDKLENKEIDVLVNLACNNAHLSTARYNPSTTLFKNNKINTLIASDGTVYWNPAYFGNNVSYTSKPDQVFHEEGQLYGMKRDENAGFLVYYRSGWLMKMQPIGKQFIGITNMVDAAQNIDRT